MLGPVAAGAAVLTVRRHVLVAVALMAVVVLCVTPAEQILAADRFAVARCADPDSVHRPRAGVLHARLRPAAGAVAAVDGRLGARSTCGRSAFDASLPADRGGLVVGRPGAPVAPRGGRESADPGGRAERGT